MRIYSAIIVIALMSCKSNNTFEPHSPQQINDKSIYHVDTSSMDEKKHKKRGKDIMQLSNWTKLISRHKLGSLAIGDSIDQVIGLLGPYFNVIYDSVPYCSGCLDDIEYYYKLMGDSLELKFTIHPGQTSKGRELIQAFVVYDTLYKTDKNVGVGNTVKDIKSNYTVSRIFYEQECGVYLFVKGFDGSFGLEYEPHDDTEKLALDDIPEDVLINQIAIY
jgi:hypothetical protein